MKGTNKSLDYLRGNYEIKLKAHRSKGICPACQEIIEKELEGEK